MEELTGALGFWPTEHDLMNQRHGEREGRVGNSPEMKEASGEQRRAAQRSAKTATTLKLATARATGGYGFLPKLGEEAVQARLGI